MANDKTYIMGGDGKQHRATRVFIPEPSEVKFSSNVNDYKVQIKVDGKWHSAVLVCHISDPVLFDNVNIDKAIVEDENNVKHTASLVAVESSVNMSSISTDIYGTLADTTKGEVAMAIYEEQWTDIKFEKNINIDKVLVKASDNKYHTALIVTTIPLA